MAGCAACSAAPAAPQLREEYGNVTGHALGEGPAATVGVDVLGDVLSVMAVDEKAVWCERIAARLAELRPDVYGEWKGETVTGAVKPWDIRTEQVWGQTDDGDGKNRRGIKRADVVAEITRREADRLAA
ncbi:hypothetical protein [Streptomyces sp. T028]|uniref:hypothetical protein n=1 Tax=Streptomyces sp. T028 TaxID=3394379 RepID=UPI003A8BB3A0